MIINIKPRELSDLKLHYTTFCNEVIKSIQNPDALAIWMYLQTQKSTYKVISSHLQKHFNIGKDRCSKALRILKEAKLIVVNQLRDEKGRMGHLDIDCYPISFELLKNFSRNTEVGSSVGGMLEESPLIKEQDVLIKKQERIKQTSLTDSVQKPSTQTSDEALAICQLLDENGISNAPIAADPDLLFAIDSGVTKSYFEAAITAANHRKINGYKYILATAKGRLEDSKKQPTPQTPRPHTPKPPELKLHASHKPFDDNLVPSQMKVPAFANSDLAFNNPDLPLSALQFLEQATPPKRKKSEMPQGLAAQAIKMLSIPRPSH